MGRKTKYVTIPEAEGNRDSGKTFLITEMSATQTELWAARAFQAIARSGTDVPDHVRGAGMAGIAILGLRAFGTIPFEDLKELMDEMFQCVKICRNKDNLEVSAPLIEIDIEEVTTRLFLRQEIFELHTGFSFAGEKSTSGSSAKQATSSS